MRRPASPVEANGNLRPWHILPATEVARQLATDPENGLAIAEVERRRHKYGANEIREAPRRSALSMLASQFSDFMIVVLILAAVVSGVIGEAIDALAIMIIVLMNGIVGFVQEFRAERAVAALRRLGAPLATVVRDGQRQTVAAHTLVPGDVVLLESGNLVPADLRLLEVAQLRVDEAILTGESIPLEKLTAPLNEPALAIGDRINMAYRGTFVRNGRGRGVVVNTGMRSELGRIAALLENETAAQTPLQRRLARFGQRLALAVIGICLIIFAAGMLRGEPPILMFLTAVSLAVAAIPEALPAVVTGTLALGARRMARRQALIRQLPAVETLGSVTYICTDKTGTLTVNRMAAEVAYMPGVDSHAPAADPSATQPHKAFYTALALCNDAEGSDETELKGDPSEAALYIAARRAGFDKVSIERRFPRVAELPFAAERRCMTTIHHGPDGYIAFTKGAPETVLHCCTTERRRGEVVPLQRELHLARAETLASDGLRVVAVAERAWQRLPDDMSPSTVESGLVFLGLIGLMDPVRPEAAGAIALCRSAGITPVMITGDHPATADAIAKRVGLQHAGEPVLTGRDLDRLSPAELAEKVAHVRVFARVSPEQKISIVRALQEQGEIVAVTGDGVNDAPALKRADIGVAMGRIGTDVAREAADMVLLDDNFATIVSAAREGRRIFDNIRKFVKYAMAANAGEIWTMFLAPFVGLPMPLLPIHILWINLVTDGLPGLALAPEPEEPGSMERPPRPPEQSLFSDGLWQHVLWVGLLMAGTALVAQAWAWRGGSSEWQTIVFTVLTLSQMGHVLAIRSERWSLFSQGLTTNLPLLGAVLLTVTLQLAVIYVPGLRALLRTSPLTASQLGMCLALSSVVFVAVEVEKWLVRRGYIYVNSATPRRTRSLKKGNTFETGAHLAAEGKEQSVR